MAKIGDGDLPDGTLVVCQGNLAIEDLRSAVSAGDGLKLDAPPGGEGLVSDFLEKILRPSAQGDESDAHLVESVEVGMGGQLGIEDELSGKGSGTLFPEFDKTKDLIVLVGFSNLGIGVAKHPPIGILSQESEDSLLLSAAFGNVVFFDQGIFPVEGNGVEVQIKGAAPAEAQASHGIKPKIEHLRVAGGIDAATVFGQESSLGTAVEPGKKGQAFVEHIAHDMAVAGIAKEFESQERAHRVSGRNHLGAGETGIAQQLIEGDLREIRQKEEKSPEACPKSSRGKVQLADIRNRSKFRADTRWPLLIAAPRKPSEALLLEDQRDGGGTELAPALPQALADVVDGKVLFAQSDDLCTEPIDFGCCPWSFGRWQEELPVRVFPELVTQHPKAARRVSEPIGGFRAGEPLDKVGAESLILTLGRVGRLQEDPC